MKKRIIFTILLCTLAAVIVTAVAVTKKDNEKYIAGTDAEELKKAYELLTGFLTNQSFGYLDFLEDDTLQPGKGSSASFPAEGEAQDGYDGLTAVLDYGEYTDYVIDIKEAGLYELVLDYRPTGKTLLDFNVDITVNGAHQYDEMGNVILPLFWSDRTKEFPVDRYGDETAPYQERKEEWTSLYLYNSTYVTADPLKFLLEEGENVIRVTNISGNGLGLGKLEAAAPGEEPAYYADYSRAHGGERAGAFLKIKAVDYVEKNTSQAIYSSENNPMAEPYDSYYKKLNTLSWAKAGAEIEYQFEAPKDGLYQIAVCYNNSKEEFSVFNTIRIDGEVPFRELKNYAFPSTGTQWANEVLSDEDGNPYEIYLTAGVHTISIRTETEPLEQALKYVKVLSEHVTQFDMAITKITGSSVDKNRTWKMTRYLPEIPAYLEAYETLIHEIKYLVQDYASGGVASAMLSELDKALAFIDQMEEYPDEIALYQDNLAKSRDNSVLKSVSEFNAKLSGQSFALNAIYVYGEGELPRPNPNVFESAWNGIKRLVYSYTSDKFQVENDPEVVNVWVNRAMTHVDLLQKMVDTEFTPKTGIKVKVSVMPDPNKLVLAAAADDVPDVALGLLSHIPFDLASRGALYDLTQFEDFWEIEDRFVPGASVSYIFNGGVYAIPETMEFDALIYRTDIFQELELTPPDTWRDVADMCPTLQRYGMNFYHLISSNAGYKWYYQTTPMIFQNGGKLYTEDGVRTAIDQPEAVKGIQALGDLFIKYSLPKEVGSFFNEFRYGTLPVGIVSLNDYILIKNGAPELRGKWALAPYPGTEEEDGSISRWFISNGTGAFIFDSTNKAQESWEFLKWWTDYETQVNYTYTLQSTYGEAYVWLSSNIDAVAEAPLDHADRQVITDQLKWLRDVPRTPGQYLVERSISDAWNAMVNEGKTAQVAVDERVVAVNREIRKKMTELGFYDKDGNLLQPYVIRDVDWIVEQIENAKQKGE